ncbi:MAG: DUF4192 domain-containing protein [Corynebacterium sp.]|nr:DUF4192 domain-containing protein [Corynebacterium sp.]
MNTYSYNIPNILATVPHILGYYPERSFVLCTVSLVDRDCPEIAQRGEGTTIIGPIGRVDLEDHDAAEMLLDRLPYEPTDVLIGINVGPAEPDLFRRVRDRVDHFLFTDSLKPGTVCDDVLDTQSPLGTVGKPFASVLAHSSPPAENRESFMCLYRGVNTEITAQARGNLRKQAQARSLDRDKALHPSSDNTSELVDIERGLAGDEIMLSMSFHLTRLDEASQEDIAKDKSALLCALSMLEDVLSRDLIMLFALMKGTAAPFSKLMLAAAETLHTVVTPGPNTKNYPRWRAQQYRRANALSLYALSMITLSQPSHALAALRVALETSPGHSLSQLLLGVMSEGQYMHLLQTTANAVEDLITKSCLSYRPSLPILT